MKRTLTLLLLALLCNIAHAQYTGMAPQPPRYPIVNMPGAGLTQIIDTMKALANPNDTGEGGELDEIAVFSKFWTGRVSGNDSSGQNMFTRYYSALRTASATSGCSYPAFAGNWQCTGPGSLATQTSGYTGMGRYRCGQQLCTCRQPVWRFV